MGSDRRVKLGELLVEVLHGRRRELELGDAPRELRQVADQHDLHGGGPEMAPTPPTLVTPRGTRGALSIIVGAPKWPPHPQNSSRPGALLDDARQIAAL